MPNLSKCKSCGANMAWVLTANGRYMPVEYTSLSVEEKTELNLCQPVKFAYGRHISHFANCPNAKTFRKGKSE